MEEYKTNSYGRIEVICGPMFSGKTEELIKRLRRACFARQNVVVFKPQIDDRYDKVDVVSHSDQRINSIPVHTANCIAKRMESLSDQVSVVGVDEAQFFDDSLVAVVERLADSGKRVIIAGLDMDYMAKPFTPMDSLLARAELITKQLAICVVCGNPAGRSQRVEAQAAKYIGSGVITAENPIEIGAVGAYEARCRHHYSAGIEKPVLLRKGRLFTEQSLQ